MSIFIVTFWTDSIERTAGPGTYKNVISKSMPLKWYLRVWHNQRQINRNVAILIFSSDFINQNLDGIIKMTSINS